MDIKKIILTALLGTDRHGYGIMKAAKEQYGKVLPTGTLYRNIDELLKSNLIVECPPPASTTQEERVGKIAIRQYYHLTDDGKNSLNK